MTQKFYEFNQNNSGGSFDVDDVLCHRLLIEADDEKDAVRQALDMGVYFDGCSTGMDCSCCGDRWYDNPDELTFPKKYGDAVFESVEEYAQFLADNYGWTTPDVRIFYKDGRTIDTFTVPGRRAFGSKVSEWQKKVREEIANEQSNQAAG